MNFQLLRIIFQSVPRVGRHTLGGYPLPVAVRVSARVLTTACRSKFLLMGSQKPLAVLRLFDELQARTVALVDTDTIWMRDPFPWLEQHPEADLFVTTDCLSHQAELARGVQRPRCGHVVGRGAGWALNTGEVRKRSTQMQTVRSGMRAATWARLCRYHHLAQLGGQPRVCTRLAAVHEQQRTAHKGC